MVLHQLCGESFPHDVLNSCAHVLAQVLWRVAERERERERARERERERQRERETPSLGRKKPRKTSRLVRARELSRLERETKLNSWMLLMLL